MKIPSQDSTGDSPSWLFYLSKLLYLAVVFVLDGLLFCIWSGNNGKVCFYVFSYSLFGPSFLLLFILALSFSIIDTDADADIKLVLAILGSYFYFMVYYSICSGTPPTRTSRTVDVKELGEETVVFEERRRRRGKNRI